MAQGRPYGAEELRAWAAEATMAHGAEAASSWRRPAAGPGRESDQGTCFIGGMVTPIKCVPTTLWSSRRLASQLAMRWRSSSASGSDEANNKKSSM
eukprot:jgi/Tetstr1/431621/TSEL_021151.t1